LEPMFRVTKAGHRLSGKLVSLVEAQDAGIELPAYRRDLFKRQLLHTKIAKNETEAEYTAQIVDMRARKLGITTEEFLARTLRGVTSGVALSPDDLRQSSFNEVFYSQMIRVAQSAGFPKRGKARDYLKQLENLSRKGKFKSEELEWSGFKEYVEFIEAYFQEGHLDTDEISR